jgi:hypothetical protein
MDGYYRRWANWWLGILFFAANTAVGVALSVWAFVTGHRIVAGTVALWTAAWTVRLFGELELARSVKRSAGHS